jgi:hypothetical protein
MAADRARLRLNLARDDSHYAGNSPGTRLHLANAENLGAMPSSESEFDLSSSSASQFMSEHALSIAAVVLGLLVVGPRKPVFAVLRNLAPLLLASGVRMLFDRHDRVIGESSISADRGLTARSSVKLGAAGEPDSAGSPHAVTGVPEEASRGRRADTACFSAATNSKRNPY